MSTQVPFKLVLGHNIARTVFTSKAHILDILLGLLFICPFICPFKLADIQLFKSFFV